MKHEFTIEISLDDSRTADVDPHWKKLCYKAIVRDGSFGTQIWSQELNDDEVGTRRSFGYMLDGIREQLLRRLCPNEPPPIPPTK
jgi:hypothetical protein